MKKRPVLLAIVGPTAVGKTEVGLECARRLAGEIVSADSMQVYREMDLGTAKPNIEQLATAPHHLIDVIAPDGEFSVALFKEWAEAAIDEIFARGHQPILVGGSGLYVRAVVGHWGMTVAPRDAALRERLGQEAQAEGLASLHARLAQVDPEAAGKISPNDEKRIIRALEVYELTGQPMSAFHRQDQGREPKYRSVIVGLELPRLLLYARIDARVDQMLAAGLLEEVQRLQAQGYGPALVSMKAIGYSHLLRYLAGEWDLPTAVETFKRDTRRFAKRQMTWFRSEPGIIWLDIAGLSAAQVADEIVRLFKERIEDA